MKYLTVCILCFAIVTSVSCTKRSEDIKIDKKSSGDSVNKEDKTTAGDNKTRAVSDTVFMARWDGKRVIIEDYYKYAENEKTLMSDTGGYDKYSTKLIDLVKKYSKYSEQTPEYLFSEFKPEFSSFTNLKVGDKLYLSTLGGAYPIEVTGYIINMDDMIGSGTIFYATANLPAGAKPDEYEVMVSSFNNNMTPTNKTGITDQKILDKYKSFLMPWLKKVKITEYDEKGKESITTVREIKNEELKLFKGNFTGSGYVEYLAGVTLRNDPTNFTSLIYILDDNGKVLKELSPLSANNFTFSSVEMICDFNGDGIWEIITSDGYYEGGGYNFHKFMYGEFKTLANGFMFGV